MNLQNPVSSLMTKDVQFLKPKDKMQAAKDLFENHGFRHIPVLDADEKLVGMISRLDYSYFLRMLDKDSQESYLNDIRLKNYLVEEVMEKNLVTVSSSDSLQDALILFCENNFHSIPVVDGDTLTGILTTHDLLIELLHSRETN